MLKTLVAYIVEAILEWAIKKYGAHKTQVLLNEKFEKELNSKTDAAVNDLRAPLDPTKSVEEREKDEEAKFDDFRNRLK